MWRRISEHKAEYTAAERYDMAFSQAGTSVQQVTVIVNGVHRIAGSDEPDITKTISRGRLIKRTDKWLVVYDEADEEEGSTRCYLSFDRDHVEMIRRAQKDIRMNFTVGETTKSHYNTPMGDLLLTIQTTEIAVEEKDESIAVTIVYKLLMGGVLEDCCVNIDILPEDRHITGPRIIF